MKLNIFNISRALLWLILLELFIGGGGRIFAFGLISLRMVLFATAMLIIISLFFKGERIPRYFVIPLITFIVILAIGIVIGILKKSPLPLVVEDVKPLLFIFILPFFYLTILPGDAIRINILFQICAVIIAIITLMILLALHLNILPFRKFYLLVEPTQEFFFRNENAFFYKGHIFLCVGFLFAFFIKTKFRIIVISLILIALLLTFTRGFLLALSLTFSFYYLFIKKTYVKAVILLCMSLLIVVAGATFYSYLSRQSSDILKSRKEVSNQSSNLLGDRKASDSERIQQLKEVYHNVTPASLLWGHGFGKGTDSRPVHMEISYAEIFHKQGFIGLGCWTLLLFLFIKSYSKANSIDEHYATAFFLSGLLIFFQSLTNQYINNPIGLGMFTLSWVMMYKLKR